MKNAGEWRVERWDGEDFIVTGFGIKHPGVFRKREADLIVAILVLATPLIQKDALENNTP